LDGSLNTSLNVLKDTSTEGIVGVESATAWWGLSSFDPDITIFLFEDNTKNNSGYYFHGGLDFLFVPDVNFDNVVYLTDKLCVTDREQTICDMIRYNRHEFHLYETVISAFDDKEINMDKLLNLAEHYGIKDKLFELYDLALECEDEG
jgi:hypothetical protein